MASELKVIRSELTTDGNLQKLVKDLSQSSGNLKVLVDNSASMMPQLNKTLGETLFTL